MNAWMKLVRLATVLCLAMIWPTLLIAGDTPIETTAVLSKAAAKVTTSVGPDHHVWYGENWENGQGFWTPSNGVWQVGTHSTVQGSQCAATNLDGNYPEHANSRLISPTIDLPAHPADDQLWLRFWHYYALTNDGDISYVEISVDGGAWTQIGNTFRRYSQTWTPYRIALHDYAGQSVRIAFHIIDSDDYPYQEGLGWYLDEIQIFDGAIEWGGRDSFDFGKYEPDWGGWTASGGLWEIGQPTYGTDHTGSGHWCAATNLDGNYVESGSSRLMSPPIDLPADPLGGELHLSLMHYFNFATDGDYGLVEIWTEESGWVQLGNDFRNSSGLWCEYTADISAFAGQTAYLGFRFVDSYDYPYQENAGWYIDDVAIVEGPTVFNNPDNFEGGCRGWYSTRGNWQIGTPTSGPGSAYSGEVCWGTRLHGNYVESGSSTLKTSEVTLIEEAPGNPIYLRFQQWYSFATDGDYGAVYIYPEDEDAVKIAGNFSASSAGWSQFQVDISEYSGQTVKFGFYLYDSNDYPYQESAGWFIDDVEILGIAQSAPDGLFVMDTMYSAGPPVVNWYYTPFDPEYTVIYVSQNQEFLPNLGNRIVMATDDPLAFTDYDRPGYEHFYQVTLMDELMHESAPYGMSAPISGVGSPEPVPTVAALGGNFPNPFNPKTMINFNLERSAKIRLSVYDVAGRCVVTLVEGELEAGNHIVPFDASKEASGLYFCRLEVGGKTQTRKMMLVR